MKTLDEGLNEEGTQPDAAGSQEQAPTKETAQTQATPEAVVSPPDLDDMSDKLGGSFDWADEDPAEYQVGIPSMGKPPSGVFFRAHPKIWKTAAIFKPPGSDDPESWRLLGSGVADAAPLVRLHSGPHLLVLCVTQYGALHFWVQSAAGVKGNLAPKWYASARAGLALAVKQWVTFTTKDVLTGGRLGQYVFRAATRDLGEPRFPADPLEALRKFQKQYGLHDPNASVITSLSSGL